MRAPTRRSRRSTLAAAALCVSVAGSALVAAFATPALPAAAAPPPDRSWTADLTVDRDDTNVRTSEDGLVLSRTAGPPALAASTGSQRAQGMLVTKPHTLDDPANRFSVAIAADRPAGSELLIDVRGRRGDGSWTEWVPVRPDAPGVLDAQVPTVQGRVTLLAGDGGASPALRSAEFTADLAPEVRLQLGARTSTYRIFATREGLVGGTTANGHVIRERDHFAALPSRRGLSPRGTGDYTVKVCADNGRCEWAPVWDVGPWNTTDDHWNPPHVRQSWRDLAQGLPQAQAAFEVGHNGRRDQFGREVTNPAGLDLADGMFWDGLRLRDNSWVTVSYLWTGSGPIATARSYLLNVRTGPTSRSKAMGLAAQHAQLRVDCVVAGQRVSGSQGTTTQWLRLGQDQYVSAAHVATPRDIRSC